MRYAQFFRPSAIDRTVLVECVGSDSVAKLDQRHTNRTSALIARSICRVRGYAGFELREGPSFSRGKVVRKLETINQI